MLTKGTPKVQGILCGNLDGAEWELVDQITGQVKDSDYTDRIKYAILSGSETYMQPESSGKDLNWKWEIKGDSCETSLAKFLAN